MNNHKHSIIFDLDNTIIHCAEYYENAYREFGNWMLENFNIAPDLAIDIVKSVDSHGIKISGFGRDRFPKSFEAASRAIAVLMDTAPPEFVHIKSWDIGNAVFSAPYSIIGNAWTALTIIKKQGFNMYCCTKGDPQIQLKKIKMNNLDKIFPDGHVYIDVVKTHKHYEKIVENNDLDKNLTYVVGDSIKDDIGSAHKAGLQSVWVKGNHVQGYAYEDEEHTPTHVIHTLNELPSLMESIVNGSAVAIRA